MDDLVARARALAAPRTRRILGIAGPPGAGKSTLAAYLARAMGPQYAALVPMDGFHLADAELRRLGRLGRKGAPDTFDPAGYAALLRRLKAPREGETVYAPGFDRELEQPLAGCVPVHADVPLVITEGNYLLLDEQPWPEVRGLLDACWYVDLDPDVRVRRLIARHERFGKAPREAERWVLENDEANAALVARTRERADLVAEFTPAAPPATAAATPDRSA
ncbi:nucleoside/nucleotide kinase family protein [Streptomyces sp. ODS28]|uniref:nucleoside/nucleotide kinase family protein n=1 Tax=Streptomyces sp. ODS28 TaxID=3136688 RepID=UPI0031F098CB